MKNILCLLSEKIADDKKQNFLEKLKSTVRERQLSFRIDLFYKNNTYDFEKYHYAVLAFPPKNILPKLSNLEFALSVNAGIDDFINEIKNNITVKRIVYPPAMFRISEYVLYCVLDYILLMDRYRTQQSQSYWDRSKPHRVRSEKIGVMGLGKVGYQIAKVLIKNNKNIIGYSRKISPYPDEFRVYNKLKDFLSQINILINALPLTVETVGIINQETLGFLPDQSCLINIGRGGHVVEADLLKALENQKLSKAYLDVFSLEPLPESHAFWRHPQIAITPHIAGIFDIIDIVDDAVTQCEIFYKKAL